MNYTEAIIALAQGKKVRHKSWIESSYVTFKDGKFYCLDTEYEYDRMNTYTDSKDDFEIYTP